MNRGVHCDAELVDLIDRIGFREEAALRLLYQQTATRLLVLAMKFVQQREAAEDVLQESFLTVWRVAHAYRQALSPPLAWLGLIVRSRSMELLRDRRRNRYAQSQPWDDVMDELHADRSSGPEELVEASQRAWIVNQCLAQLGRQQRQALLFAYHRDMSFIEISESLGIPLATAKSRVRRGLGKLRDQVDSFDGAVGDAPPAQRP